MVMMMTVSLFSSVGIASAEPVTDFAVTINFYEFDQTTPAAPYLQVENHGNPYTDKNYHVVVTLKDKGTGEVAGYGFADIENINQATQTLHITEFYTTAEDDGSRNPLFEPLEYDPEQYVASGVRLYYGKSPARGIYGYPGVAYSELITQQDTIDGYIFMGSDVDATTGEINLYKGTQEYAVRISFTDDAGTITADDGYYILVSAKHKSGNNEFSYYYAPLVTNENEGDNAKTVDFVVANGNGIKNGPDRVDGDWLDNNGHKTPEKYTGNWKEVTVKIIKVKPELETEPNLNDVLQGTNITEVKEVKNFRVTHQGITPERDEFNWVVKNYDVVELSELSVAADYNYLTVLGDAVNYGIVSSRIMQSNHSEGNFATKVYGRSGDLNFDPDLSGNGTEQVPGNYLVGRIEGEQMRFGNKTPATAAVFVGDGSASKVESNAPGNVIIIPMKEPEINSAIDNMISHMKRVSRAMAAKEATLTPDVISNTLYLDTTSFEDGVTIYIDADAYNGEGKPFSADEGAHIKMKPNQMIVFNFKEATDVLVTKVVVDFGDGTGEHTTDTDTGIFLNGQNYYADKINRQLVWNCPVAKNIDTHISGGIYLAPQNDAKMTLGHTTTGWGVCAGEVVMGKTSEYHFVYQGLTKENGVTLKAFKQVDGEPAGENEKFEFALERYDADRGEFTAVQTDLTFENDGESIEIPVTVMTGGRNIFRIVEVGKSDSTEGTYTLDEKAVYVQFDVTITDLAVMIPGPVNYYKKFENGEVREKMNEADRTFHNTKVTTNNDDPNGNGTNDDPNGNGTNDDPNGNGTNDDPNGSGTNDDPNGNGTNDDPNGSGTNDDPNGNGTNDNTNGNGTNDNTNGNGTNDNTNGNGTNDNTNGNGTNDNTNGNGTNDNTNGNGTNDNTNGNGTNDNTNGNGTNDNTNGNGTNDNTNGNGTNDNTNGNGTNDNTNGNGTDDNTNGNGTNDSTGGNGTNDTTGGNGTNGNGANDTTGGNGANGNGTNDSTGGNGTNDTTGGNGTNGNGANDTTGGNGANGNGTNDNTNSNGTNDNTNGSGTNDSTGGNGTNNTTGGNGTTNTPSGNGGSAVAPEQNVNPNTAGNTTQNSAAGEATQNSTGEATQNSGGDATQNAASNATQNNTGEVAQNTTGEAAQQTTGEATQNATGEAAQQTTGEAKQNTTGEAAQNTTGDTATAVSGGITTTVDGSTEKTVTTPPAANTETSVKTGDTISNSLVILMMLLSILTVITVMLVKTERVRERC